MIDTYCRNMVEKNTLEDVSPLFKKFVVNYKCNLDILAQIIQRGTYEVEDFESLDFYCSIEDIDEADEKAEKYLKDFKKDFIKVREDIESKTGAIINVGYAEDLSGNIEGYYFYVENAYIKNPKINKNFVEKIKQLAIAENL